MKRGQLTAITIVALLILVIAVVLAYLSRQDNEEQLQQTLGLPPFAEQVYLYMDSCMKQVAPPALQQWGKQSGYAMPPDDAIQGEESKIAIYYKKGENDMPAQSAMLAEGAKMIQERVEACAQQGEFSGIVITPTKAQATIMITEENVVAKVVYPMTIQKEEETIMLDTPYTLTMPIRLKRIWEGASAIVAMEMKDPKNVDLTLLMEQDIDVEITPISDAVLVYTLIDQHAKIKEEKFVWMFANKL